MEEWNWGKEEGEKQFKFLFIYSLLPFFVWGGGQQVVKVGGRKRKFKGMREDERVGETHS